MFSEMDDSKKQAEWDRRCESAPRCKVCGSPVIRYGDTYYEFGDTIVCDNCRPGFMDALEEAVLGILDAIKCKAARHIQEV